jgi:ABC-type sugar transport system permease subunit
MDKLRRLKLPFTILAVILILLLAWALRWRAVTMLPGDYDEDDYLRAAQQYAALIRAGDWKGFTENNYRYEHPPLAKIVFGFSLLSAPEAPLLPNRPTTAPPDQSLPKEQLRAARTSGAVLGTLTVALLALVNPLAGLFLAVHGMTIKYADQVMLEALPAFTSLAMVLAYIQSKKQKAKTRWLVISAIFLGLTAASKYLYCVAGIAVLVDWYLDNRSRGVAMLRPYRDMILWGLLAVITFFATNPYLWPDPIGRLKESVFYHAGYSTGAAEVQQANFPIWQPLIWLTVSPYSWHEGVFLLGIDPLIALLAAFGLARLWKKGRVYVLWLGIGLLFLFLWPTKWPQYIVMLTVPLSLAAAEGVMAVIVDPVRGWLASRKIPHITTARPGELRRAAPWLSLGLLAFIVLTIFPLLFQIAISITSLDGQSLRDGLHGGIVREVWGGLTGQIPVAGSNATPTQVHFIGLDNYPGVFDWLSSMGLPIFSIMWTVFSVTLQLALGLGAALLLWNKRVFFRKGWQTFFILPWAIPEAIGALMWFNIFVPFSGWLALAVKEYGAASVPFSFLMGWERNPNLTIVVLLLCTLWYGFPFMMLAISAGLKMLPDDVLDAASIDGANAWQTFRYVIWPMLTPLVVPAIIIRAIFAFNQFYLFQMIAPIYTDYNHPIMTLSTFSYYLLYRGGEFSISAVINIITILMLIGFVIVFNRWSKAGEGVTYA